MPFLLERRIDLKESPIKTERKTLHLPEDTVRALNKLAAKMCIRDRYLERLQEETEGLDCEPG